MARFVFAIASSFQRFWSGIIAAAAKPVKRGRRLSTFLLHPAVHSFEEPVSQDLDFDTHSL